MDADSYASPEEAALAGWPAASRATVVSSHVKGDSAEVVIDTDPPYRYWVYCVRRHDGRWRETVSGDGPAAGWDDPSALRWD